MNTKQINAEINQLLPRWIQEFKRFLYLKSQFYFYGNIYDSYFFPVNYREVVKAEELIWAQFVHIKDLLKKFLLTEGYELVIYYDFLDGFEFMSKDDMCKGKENEILNIIKSNNEVAREYFKNVDDINKIRKNLLDTLFFMRFLSSNTKILSAGIVNFTSRFSANPNILDEKERNIYLTMLKSVQEAHTFRDKGGMKNILIFICDKLNDIPSWLLLENPLTKGIEILKPNSSERLRFFDTQSKRFFNNKSQVTDVKLHMMPQETDIEKIRLIFPDLTEGFTNIELENLITISEKERIPIEDIKIIIDLFKYGVKENFWEKLDISKVNNAERELKKRVIGQDKAVRKCVEVIKRAKLGLNNIDQVKIKNSPKGKLFFAGPTGTGKTELAKSLAELLFSDENAIIRFDMSEYNESNSDVKLIGAPPGYVGYEEGGQLTKQVKSKPFSIILFDEIEKAHPIVFDKFLQILDDGRLTDSKGETVYFSETFIIFTSNLGIYSDNKAGERVLNIDINDPYEVMSERIMNEIKNFFNKTLNRPEILNRFGENFVVFDFIRPDNDKKILIKNLDIIKTNLMKIKSCVLEYDDEFIELFRKYYIKDNLIYGGRGIVNRIESVIKNGMTNFFFSLDRTNNFSFKMYIDERDIDPDLNKPKVKFEITK